MVGESGDYQGLHQRNIYMISTTIAYNYVMDEVHFLNHPHSTIKQTCLML